MQHGLRTMLIGAAILPPILAGGWFAIGRVINAAGNTRWDDWQPLLQPIISLSALVGIAIIIVAMCHRFRSA